MEEAMVMMGKDKARTHAVMMNAFHRKINTGIAGHIQGVLQDGIMVGVNAVIDGIKAGVDTARQTELEGKSAEELTGDEATELGHLQAREYRTLQEKVDEGVELTPAEVERFRGYEAMAAAARASVVAAEAARIQRKVDAKKAEAEAITGAAIAWEREAALKAQRMEGY